MMRLLQNSLFVSQGVCSDCRQGGEMGERLRELARRFQTQKPAPRNPTYLTMPYPHFWKQAIDCLLLAAQKHPTNNPTGTISPCFQATWRKLPSTDGC